MKLVQRQSGCELQDRAQELNLQDSSPAGGSKISTAKLNASWFHALPPVELVQPTPA